MTTRPCVGEHRAALRRPEAPVAADSRSDVTGRAGLPARRPIRDVVEGTGISMSNPTRDPRGGQSELLFNRMWAAPAATGFPSYVKEPCPIAPSSTWI